MGTSNMQVLHRDDLPLGGFAGLREHRLVMDPKVFGHHRHPQAWPGLGNFVYLADARFNPKGETRLHDHQEIDVISIMVAGRIRHEGSLEHGQELNACDVQVQRAGGEGFRHNEVNPDDRPNRMLQLWAVPEQSGLPAGYKTYHPARGVATRIYGGAADQRETFAERTLISVAPLEAGDRVAAPGPFMAYLAGGEGVAGGLAVSDGDLMRGEDLTFEAGALALLVLVQLGY